MKLNRRDLKRKGKSAFYRNWKSSLIICFIFTILVGGTIFSIPHEIDLNPKDNIKNIDLNIKGDNNSEIVNNFLYEVTNKTPYESKFIKSSEGFIGSIVNNVSKSGSFLFGVLNALNQGFFQNKIGAGIIIIVGAIISFIYWMFGSKVLEVGQARFFLENRKYAKTKANKLFLPYMQYHIVHTAFTMFVTNLYTLLWSLTIVGVYKIYSYRLVPYILAENPKMRTRDVIKLSRDLMNGHKWEMFLMDLSFIGWGILGIITFNISNLVFTNPYKNATMAEYYMNLRKYGKDNNIKNSDLLTDHYLEGDIVFDEYPSYEYMLRTFKERKWLHLNYKRKYSILDLILLFFIISFVGWIWEVLLHLFQYGELVNRGALHGPWLPIYGGGSIAVLVLLQKFRKNPFQYFVLTMIVCGIIEYGTSLYLEVVHHMQWWDYTGFFLNINGRVCLEGLLFFAIGGLVVTYVVAPLAANFLDKIKKEPKLILCVILITLIASDFAYSGDHPNTGNGVSNQIEKPTDIKIK